MLQATNYKLQASEGFTLIELLTAIAIIGILSAMVLAKSNTSRQNLNRAVQQLALDVRKAQNFALAPDSGATPACLYGLSVITSNQYILYRKPAPCPTPRNNPNNNEYNNAADTIMEAINLGNGITIKPPANQDVAFEAPEPITYTNGNTNSSLSIILKSADGNEKTIKINRFGQVEIQ